MKCPKCQYENPDGAKFCRDCGASLTKDIVCPNCGSSHPPSSKFCINCGHQLARPSEPAPKDLSFDEKIEKIQKYLPQGLTDKILSQRDKIEGERKQVTVLFCDMEGFTPLIERLGPEEAYAIMDDVYELLIHKVHDYEGTVNEMTGDGIMALFGAPIALEDAPQRAIRSALAIHREMSRFSDGIKQERGEIPPLKMRIGIHTGPVVVGTLGNDLRVEFKVVGDTVNLASRMEALAEPGTTYVTEEIFKLTEGLFHFEALGEREIKGKEESVKTYQVIAPSTRRTRFDVVADRGLTPFVGRGRELEILLDGFQRCKEGRGQAIAIVSDAGVGKSRLLYEFRKAVSGEDVFFLEGRCLSYSRGVAYHLHRDILKANFNIKEGDDDAEIKEKVKRGLKLLDIEEASTLPYILEILSVKDSGIDKIPLSQEAKKDRIIEALIRIVLRGSEIRPLILAYEDLHWIDKNSEEVLKFGLESIPGSRVLMIITYRTEFGHTLGGKSYQSQITLNRLANRESLAMVAHLLGTEEIDRDFEDLILEKTEGVPFFIEEFIKSLKELSIIEKKNNRYVLTKDIQDVTIPSTIQDVIMARVDSLPEGAKEVLQTGSVIEREFGYDLIKTVVDLTEQELLSYISILKDLELLYERGMPPESTYVFKHALTREVVYDSILEKKKKRLHELIGNAIEELHQSNLVEHFEILAEHFIAGENYEKGADYSKLACKKAEKTGSLFEAIAHAKRQISSLEKLPKTIDVQKMLIDARTTLGLYLFQTGNFVPAKEAIEPIIQIALESDYKRRLSEIFLITGVFNYYIEENSSAAIKEFQEALKISQEMQYITSLFFAHYWLGMASGHNCEFQKGYYHLEKALDINIAANSVWGISVIKNNLSQWIYNPQGQVSQGYETSSEAVRLAEESGDKFSKAMSYVSHGFSCFLKRISSEGEEYLLKGADSCESINFLFAQVFAEFHLGELYFETEEYEKSKDHYQNAIGLMEQSRLLPSWMNLNRIGLSKAMVMNNERDIDLVTLYRYEKENKIKLYKSSMRRYIAEILLNIDDQHMSEAEDWIIKAIETDEMHSMMWYLGRDYVVYAELFKRKGDRLRARAILNKAVEIFKECGSDGWVEKYEKELADFS